MTIVDRVILALALALVAGLYVTIWQGGDATAATIWVDGEQRTVLPLTRERTIRVSGVLGESVIQVGRGRIRVVSSPGPRKICVRAGWLRHPGESAICLPNRVVVQVVGDTPGYDGINF
ncbi:MAG: NusG domain II-containing protein [Ectothiorhodospiraceae bacterium]|jgi:hypothetical protein